MKTRTTLLLAGILSGISLFAQRDIKGLIGAEKAFASFTQSHTIKEGFLKYMDEEGIVFRQAKPVNALEAYQKQPASPAVLSWEPAFAVISASGDFGITTGPYILHPKPGQDTPVFRGSFSSVWQINKQGKWKNIIDLGSSYARQLPALTQVQEVILTGKTAISISLTELLALDNKLNQDIKEKSGGSIAAQIAADSWLNLEGENPVRGVQPISNLLQHIPDTVIFKPESGKISSAGDLAYVYGTVTNGAKQENYLRVWANRNKRWQVILQTIRW